MISGTLHDPTTNGDATTPTVATAGESIDVIARLRQAITKPGGELAALFSFEKKFLTAVLEEIDLELTTALRTAAKAKEDKSSILDSLLAEVRENKTLEQTVVDQRGTIADCYRDLANLDRDVIMARKNAVEAERTINALTKISPDIVRKAAFTITENVKEIEIEAQNNLEMFLISGVTYAGALGKMREGARQLEEHAIAIERANDGVKAR